MTSALRANSRAIRVTSAGVDAGVLLLPGRRARQRVVVAGRPVARQAVAGDAELRAEQVEDGRDELAADALGGDAAAHDAAALGVADLEARRGRPARARRARRAATGAARLAELEVPLALALLAPAEAERAVRHDRLAGRLVEDDGLPLGVLARSRRGRGAQEAVGDVGAVALAQRDEERQVGALLRVVVEVRRLLLDVVLLDDHVGHRQRERGVGAGLGGQPVVGELRVAGVVGRDDDDLLAPVARLGHEVRVRRARLRDVRAPEHHVARVPPVGGLRHVGLVAPDLRRGRRQVRVPVVERQADAADQREEARAGGVGDRRHRGDRREPDDAVRPVALGRVHVGGGDDLADLVPGRAQEAAQAALGLVGAGLLGVLDDRRPRVDRVAGACELLAVEPQQRAAHVGVADADRRVDVPGERRAARAAARLVLGHVRAVGRVVGLLRLPGDEPVLDVDLPRARARAVDAVRRAHDLVVAASGRGRAPPTRASGASAVRHGVRVG